MKKAPIFVVVLLLVALTSCIQDAEMTLLGTPEPTTTNPFGDGGLLSKEPCTPPCFYGIIPGLTTEEGARETLEQNVVFENCEEFDNSAQGGSGQGIRCNFFGIHFSESMVYNLGFYPESELTLGKIIAEYGEPDQLYTFSSSTPDYPLYGDLNLCFESLSMIVGLPAMLGEVYSVSQETKILFINYLSSQENYTNLCYDLEGSQPWVGYGEYPVYFIR